MASWLGCGTVHRRIISHVQAEFGIFGTGVKLVYFAVGAASVPLVFQTNGLHYFVGQGHTDTRHLYVVARVSLGTIGIQRTNATAASRSPYANNVVGVQNIGRGIQTILLKRRNRNLHYNGVAVLTGQTVAGCTRSTNTAQIENTTQVSEERVIGRTAEHLGIAARHRHRLNGIRHQRIVRRIQAGCTCNRAWPNIGWGHRAIVDEHGERATRPANLKVVGRFEVLLTQADIEEGKLVFVLTFERETVRDVIRRGTSFGRIVFHVDFIPDILTKRIVVRSALGQLEWNVVGNNRNRVRVVRAAESIQVGVIGQRVVGDEWGFTVARGLQRVVLATPGQHASYRSCEQSNVEERTSK